MILRLNKNKTLSIYRNTPVYIGENKFNKITFLLPESIDNNLVSEMLFKVHVVNSKSEYMLVNLAVEDNNSILQGSIDIDKVITDESQMLNIYVEMYDNEDKIGKTNCIELFVNPLPDEKERIYSYQELLDRIQELENENEEQEETIKTIGQLIEENTEAMNRINEFEDGKSAYEIAVEHGYEGTEEEWLSEMKDYSKLNNKPQINGHELVGDKSSDDLGLQGKLTAGENVTIEANGRISASGGVTSYTELSDKPIIVGTEEPYYSQPITLEGAFYTNFFTFEQREDGNHNVKLRDISGVIITDNSIPYDKLSDSAQKAIFKDYGFYPYPPSDLFTNPWHAPASNGVWHIGDTDLVGQPVAKPGRLYNYFNDRTRIQFYVTDCYLDHLGAQQCFMRVQDSGNLGVWQEFAFKKDIVSVTSATVNQNGTITFTMSDGSTVTTTGESVIGPQGPAGADGQQGPAGADWVPTETELNDIAQRAVNLIPTTQGVQYGNTSN